MKLKDTSPWKKSYDKPRQCIKKQKQGDFPAKVPFVKAIFFFSRHVQMWQLDHREGWVLKIWCFQTVMLVKTLERPLDSKEIKPVNLKGNQSWIFIGRTDAEVEALVLWPADEKSQLMENMLLLGKIECRRRWGGRWERMRWLDSIINPMDMSLSRLREIVINADHIYDIMSIPVLYYAANNHEDTLCIVAFIF